MYSPSLRLNPIDQREDDDPDDVNEVPVKPGKLDVQRVLLLDAAAQGIGEKREQDQYADRDVGTVESREHVERRTEKVGVEAQASLVKLRELVHLAGDKQRSENGGCEEPYLHVAHVATLDGSQRQHHTHAAH